VVSPTFTNRKSGCFFEDCFINIIGVESRNNSVRYYGLFYCGFGEGNPPPPRPIDPCTLSRTHTILRTRSHS
jgi:hypothetical protein